jgi:NADH-quinone oxidoreductase subunit C
MRKDFDPLEYSKRKFPDRKYDMELSKNAVKEAIKEGGINERT